MGNHIFYGYVRYFNSGEILSEYRNEALIDQGIFFGLSIIYDSQYPLLSVGSFVNVGASDICPAGRGMSDWEIRDTVGRTGTVFSMGYATFVSWI